VTWTTAADSQGSLPDLPVDWLTDFWDWFTDRPWDVIIAFALGWCGSVLLAVLRRQAEAHVDSALGRALAHIRKRRHERKDARQRRRTDADSAKELERLRQERVGRRFLHHVTPDDPGLIGEVINLDKRSPKRSVMVRWEGPPTRTPTPHDPTGSPERNIDWRQLRCPVDEQRRRTANYKPRHPGGENGWVEFEEIENPGTQG
jgi:hypothetical protein